MRSRRSRITCGAVDGTGYVLSNVLKQKGIFNFFSRSAMHKAWAYHAQRRVTAVEISDDFTNIRARVTGSAKKPYAVDIDLR